MIPSDQHSGWPKVPGLKGGNSRGGWAKFIGLKGGGKPIRGGWGYFIGLKGGSPVTTSAEEETPVETAVTTTSSSDSSDQPAPVIIASTLGSVENNVSPTPQPDEVKTNPETPVSASAAEPVQQPSSSDGSTSTSSPATSLLSSALTAGKFSSQAVAGLAQEGAAGLNPENQNALLKQLLSSTPSQKSNSETSPVKTGFSLEAQLDQPTDSNETYKNLPKEALSSLASQIPSPQAQLGSGAPQAASAVAGVTPTS